MDARQFKQTISQIEEQIFKIQKQRAAIEHSQMVKPMPRSTSLKSNNSFIECRQPGSSNSFKAFNATGSFLPLSH
jgi:hypothetical protein